MPFMNRTESTAHQSILRHLPSIDKLLHTETAVRLATEGGVGYLTWLARKVIEDLRDGLRVTGEKDLNTESSEKLLAEAEHRLDVEFYREKCARTRRVINATGVVVHTNLGRAPLSEDAKRSIIDAAGYATVEYDVSTGSRGKRGSRAESLICELTGAESAIIVNNCAAAAFLTLTVFAAGGEVLVSRGELVEIGGDFRVPDILVQSGARLREIGSTNRTRVSDYEKAITDETRLILKVHPSNYRIVGFSASASLNELAALAKTTNLILYEDAGSGALIDVREFGLTDEPVISDSIAAGVDLVTFSGDKLLGGPQAGIIAGKKEFIEKIRKHPLYRALRVDKIVYAALEATLESYRREKAADEIPVVRMLSMVKPEISRRANSLIEKLGDLSDLVAKTVDGKSAVGGGASPDFQPETTLIALTRTTMSAERLEYALRNSDPPVIARIVDGKVLLDLRTVDENQEEELIKILSEI